MYCALKIALVAVLCVAPAMAQKRATEFDEPLPTHVLQKMLDAKGTDNAAYSVGGGYVWAFIDIFNGRRTKDGCFEIPAGTTANEYTSSIRLQLSKQRHTWNGSAPVDLARALSASYPCQRGADPPPTRGQ